MADINLRGASDNINVTLQAMQAEASDDAQELRAEQKSSELAFKEQLAETVNPNAAKLAKKEKPIKAQMSRVQKSLKSGDSIGRMLPVEEMKKMADRFQENNRELKAKTLLSLREEIDPDDSKEEILIKVLKAFPDISLADEALEFLLLTTEGELHSKIREIKAEINQERGREIAAGRNIHEQAWASASKELGTSTDLRQMYRDITGNPREAPTLFEEFSKKYAFKDLKKVIDFLLHSLGSDMKSKGPSIEPGELHRLFNETRSLQAILGVYRHFRNRMNLVKKLFQNKEIPFPQDLNFEKMSKEFMSLASERYPSPEKVLQHGEHLGTGNNIEGKIITLSQFRDGVREMAMAKIYKSLQHRDDLYLAILEALEELEDDLDKENEALEDMEVDFNEAEGQEGGR